MLLKNYNQFLLFIFLIDEFVESYIVFPLKSTDSIYFSNLNNYITINDNKTIMELFSKWVNNNLYTDLIIGEPNQIATAFLSTEEYGFTFYEEFSTKELKELRANEYKEYSINNSKTVMHSNELNFNFSFWEFLSYEEPLLAYKYNDNEIFTFENLDKNKYKTKNIHFLYAIRHSSKVFNSTEFKEFEKNYQESKNELRKLNYTSFSYFCFGLQLGGRRYTYQVKNIVGELLSKNEIISQDWSIYFIDKYNKNIYTGFLFLGSAPHQYLSNIYDENQLYLTESDSFGYEWTWRASLSFYKAYIKIEGNMLDLNKYEMKAKLDFNFEIIKGTSSSKSLLEEYFFNSLIESKKCFESKINKTSLSYYHFFLL